MPHVFVDDLDRPDLDAADHHHLTRVLRTRPGDEVTVSDGVGGWRPCRLGGSGDLEPTAAVQREPAPSPAITICFALVKGERPELAVQKLTELGVDRIVPFVADRSVVRWDDDRAERNLARLRKVAREAAMQSRRVHLPVVEGLATFTQVAGRPGAALAEAGGGGPTLEHPVLLVGPEGGWSDDEAAAGLPRVTLGAHVLRAETAAITAGALLVALRIGIVDPRFDHHAASSPSTTYSGPDGGRRSGSER